MRSTPTDGLVIVGVHTPEFDFEKDRDNVIEATEGFGLKWPIAQDNDFKTWRAFDNRYWPAKYLVDKDGYHSLHSLRRGRIRRD